MKQLFTNGEYLKAKSTDKLPCQCNGCGNTFHVEKKMITYGLKHNKNINNYCSNKCQGLIIDVRIERVCGCCDKKVKRTPKIINSSKSGRVFCSRSCSVTYNNTHKKYGTRKSKLEKWLETKLIDLYPELEIHFNRKDAINSELDIYIPSLKLGFELNGIFHYEPIYGQDKLDKIKNNDNRKFQACIEQNIELCIIDSSQQKYFKEKTSQKYLDIIVNLLNSRLSLEDMQ